MNDYVDDILKEFDKDKQFVGKIRLANTMPNIEVIPTGIEELDHVVIGLGGIPRGRITTMWGPTGCGKSTLSGHIVANMQKNNYGLFGGGTAAVFDSEGKFDPTWWEKWGVDSNKVFKMDFDYGEEAYDQMMKLFDKVDIILLDSFGALLSLEGATGSEKIAPQARMHTKKIMEILNGTLEQDKYGNIKGRLTPKLSETKTAVIFLNQERENFGVMFGKRSRMPEPKASKHLRSLLLRMDVIAYGKEKDKYGGPILHKMRIRADRNNFAPPLRSCDIWLNLEEIRFETVGISFIINIGEDKGLLERRGAWIYSNELPEGKIHGSEKLWEYFQTPEGEELMNKILDKKKIEVRDIEEEKIIDEDEIDETILKTKEGEDNE